MKNRDFVVGMILSFACEGAATVKREPTAYSYNGVVLPKLPEWDKEAYLYVYIYAYLDGSGSYLFYSSVPLIDKGTSLYPTAEGSLVKYKTTPNDQSWVFVESKDLVVDRYAAFILTAELVWSGETDPIPIYE